MEILGGLVYIAYGLIIGNSASNIRDTVVLYGAASIVAGLTHQIQAKILRRRIKKSAKLSSPIIYVSPIGNNLSNSTLAFNPSINMCWFIE